VFMDRPLQRLASPVPRCRGPRRPAEARPGREPAAGPPRARPLRHRGCTE